MIGVFHWGTELSTALSSFVLSVSHWISARAAGEHCYSALQRGAQGFAELPQSRGTGRPTTATAGAQRAQWQRAPRHPKAHQPGGFVFLSHPLTILQFCENELWRTHGLVRQLFKIIHHRSLILKKWTTSFVYLPNDCNNGSKKKQRGSEGSQKYPQFFLSDSFLNWKQAEMKGNSTVSSGSVNKEYFAWAIAAEVQNINDYLLQLLIWTYQRAKWIRKRLLVNSQNN